MYKFRYQVARIRNMTSEWLRLTKLYLTKDKRSGKTHLHFDWDMNSYDENNILGRPYQIVDVQTEMTDPSWHKDYKYRTTEHVKVPRDFYDQIIETIRDIVLLYWRNVFIEQTCTHPHHQVCIEWDGEPEYGYTKQLRCDACNGGYVSKEDIDRYLPEEERHPDQIKGNPVDPMSRPETIAKHEAKMRERLRDSDDDMFFTEDYLD